MYGYKCDKCGEPVNVDPGDERICKACEDKHLVSEKNVKITYQERKREVCHI